MTAPATKHDPRQRRRLAKIEPRMAALMTGTFDPFLSLLSSTMNRMISTTEPRVVSKTTAIAFCGILRESSCPAKPSMLAAGTMAMKLVMKMASSHSGLAKCWNSLAKRTETIRGKCHTRAIATGTTGHSKLAIIDRVLLLLKAIVANLTGLKPLLPLSPSG